jgi:NAD kinase
MWREAACENALCRWITRHGPQADILVDSAFQQLLRNHSFAPSIRFVDPARELLESNANLLITCGGDGTLLRAAALFQDRSPPPIVPFSLGSLGFLSSFGKTVL